MGHRSGLVGPLAVTIARPRAATSWDLVLDALDDRLVRVAHGPDAGNTCDQWKPPSNLGPLPLRLAGRARSLLERSEHLVDEIEVTQAEVARELSTLARRSSTQIAASASATVDVSA